MYCTSKILSINNARALKSASWTVIKHALLFIYYGVTKKQCFIEENYDAIILSRYHFSYPSFKKILKSLDIGKRNMFNIQYISTINVMRKSRTFDHQGW